MHYKEEGRGMKKLVWMLATLLAVGSAQAQSDITMEQAISAATAAVEKAEAIDTKMNVAIVDAGGNLKTFVRMDGAWLGSIDISVKKAKTARYFDMNTGEIGKLSQPGGPLYNIEHSNNGLITFPGGVPLRNAEGAIIGAIGVSGSTVENDHTVAEAGAKALGGAAAPAAAAQTDEQALREMLDKAKAAVAAKDTAGILALVSENFYHPQVGGKASAKQFLQMGVDSGYADGAQLKADSIKIDIKGDTATGYPIYASSNMGSVTVGVTVKKEGGKWLITSVEVEGI